MSNLLVTEPTIGDSIESAFRRFIAPVAFDRFLAPTTFDMDVPEWNMRLDVLERDNAYEIMADLPGVKKDDINIRIDGNVVQIDAEMKHSKEIRGNGNKVLRSERYRGSLSRSLSLAYDVDETKSHARYADGVLTLELPKKTSSTAKKLQIQ
jgi:HSP20 family protein